MFPVLGQVKKVRSCQFITIKLFIEHLLYGAPSHFWCFLPVKVAEWMWLCVSLVCLSYSIPGKGSHFWDSKLGSMNIPSFTFFLWGMSCRQRAHDHPAETMGTVGAAWDWMVNLPHSSLVSKFIWLSHMPFSLASIINIDAILTSIFIPFLFTWFSQPRHQMWGCWVYC